MSEITNSGEPIIHRDGAVFVGHAAVSVLASERDAKKIAELEETVRRHYRELVRLRREYSINLRLMQATAKHRIPNSRMDPVVLEIYEQYRHDKIGTCQACGQLAPLSQDEKNQEVCAWGCEDPTI